MNHKIFLLLIVILAVSLPFIFNIRLSEGFDNYKINNAMSDFPDSQTNLLVEDTYPAIGKNQLSNNTSSKIWWHYPIFQLGSYKQITNNIRYPNNPDEGTCMPASMCGALYHEKKTGENIVQQLPPVNPSAGTRVGYFTTDEQLIDSLPFRTDMSNILY
jgi:hypothetical protein